MTDQMIRRPQRRRQRDDRVTVSIYTTREMAMRLDILARDKGSSRSDVARQILEAELLADRVKVSA